MEPHDSADNECCNDIVILALIIILGVLTCVKCIVEEMGWIAYLQVAVGTEYLCQNRTVLFEKLASHVTLSNCTVGGCFRGDGKSARSDSDCPP